MPKSKPTPVQSKKKNRSYLTTSKRCRIIEDSHLFDHYSNQLLEDPFCCENIQVKQEPQDDYPLESLPSADKQKSNGHLDNKVIIINFPHGIFHRSSPQEQHMEPPPLRYISFVQNENNQPKEQHMEVYCSEKPHSCMQCRKGFTTNFSLQKHIRTHTQGINHSPVMCVGYLSQQIVT